MYKIENPYADWKEIKREDITLTSETPKMPEKPNLLTREKKEEQVTALDTFILE